VVDWSISRRRSIRRNILLLEYVTRKTSGPDGLDSVDATALPSPEASLSLIRLCNAQDQETQPSSSV